MDTRAKVLNRDQLAERLADDETVVCVTGHFDPLLAEHAERLRELAAKGKPVVVLVTDPPEPLLDSRSRAELVAALDCVEAVVEAPHSVGVLDDIPVSRLVREQDRDIERRRRLIERVQARHGNP